MNSRIKLRLTGLAAGAGLMGVLIVFLSVMSRWEAGQLRQRLNEVDSESFRIADEFRDALRQLNNSLYRFASDHDPVDLKSFLQASDQLNTWIDEQKPKLTAEPESSLMRQIDASYDLYLAAAKELQARLQSLAGQTATISDFSPVMKESQHLFALGRALAKAHYESRGLIVSQANRTIGEVWVLQLVSLGCLFAFAVTLAVMAYRHMILPLHAKVVEGQALLERQEKLASLGLLAAGVAHEIRNPLTAIKGTLFLQQRKFHPNSPEYADAKLAEREILRLENIVSDFLLFARPSELQLMPMAADAPLREVQTLLAPDLARNDIQLILEESPPAQIVVDSAQIKQVLINLVRNAADAIAHSGVVRLRARLDRKRIARSETDVVILEVADNGKGIPPGVEKRLFDPFFTTKESGTGLGLSIAVGIVQKHGGAIEYQTQVDYGTTFGIILPQMTR